jgi:nicotinate-nucleotide adenylyltransferase
MQRIGIYGGTFNPVHIGHIRAAKYAIDALDLDQLLLIPNRTTPCKQGHDLVEPQHRLAMLRIAASKCEKMEVSDMELTREGISYTYQTLQQLRCEYPDAELVLLVGSDMFQSIHNWKNAEEILKLAQIGAFCRGGRKEAAALDTQREKLEAMGAKIHLLHNPVIDISSTQLRRMLVFRCASPFLPEGVEDYIREQGLYGVNDDYRNLPMEQLEKVVIDLLNPNRVAHVLGCRDTAAQLAQHWGADVTDAARAGLLHDITKAIDGPLQLTLCQAYGTILSDFDRKYPKTLHALTGSLVADRIFGENEAVVSAICSHTTGKADMNLLEKIVYVADYMEPNRDFPGVEKLREMAFTDMDKALRLGLEMTLEHLKRQGSEVSPESREALAFLGTVI